MISKRHAVTDGTGNPAMPAVNDGLRGEHIGAKFLYPLLPDIGAPHGDKGYIGDEFRDACNVKKTAAYLGNSGTDVAPKTGMAAALILPFRQYVSRPPPSPIPIHESPAS